METVAHKFRLICREGKVQMKCNMPSIAVSGVSMRRSTVRPGSLALSVVVLLGSCGQSPGDESFGTVQGEINNGSDVNQSEATNSHAIQVNATFKDGTPSTGSGFLFNVTSNGKPVTFVITAAHLVYDIADDRS